MECVKELKQLTETAGFCLTKWSSNEAIVLRSLLEKDVASECKAIMALGIVWDNKEDIITFSVIRVARPDQQLSKREMFLIRLECLVRSVKTALRKVLGRTSLDEEELATVLCGIEFQLIERVDAVTFSDRKSFGRCALRPKSSRTNDGYHRKSNKALALKLIAHFRKGWRSEYIATFCTRPKWRSDSIESNVGDIVLIAEEDVNKGRWMMGRVLELFYGRDKIVKSVRLKVANGEITRPMKKLRLLEPAIVDGVPPSSGEDIVFVGLCNRETSRNISHAKRCKSLGRRRGSKAGTVQAKIGLSGSNYSTAVGGSASALLFSSGPSPSELTLRAPTLFEEYIWPD
ncbi:hypothetical protein T11_13607 [Trichinella zimbabwensis]|uniref:DUF5641 domain-containing protein n=1 Tax=Trichinella zimbabwensis TaxID=268475 RepID=A0A0V1H233_9BILA|nr:hypothetical protein T11_13607 [Trichinella zimbabwensis]